MTIQEIHRLREEKPFRPFRVLTADGRAYEVVHPECLAQSPSGRMILIALPDDSSVTLDLLLVTGIHKGIKPGKNGSGRKSK
jgi:hypothetical protein